MREYTQTGGGGGGWSPVDLAITLVQNFRMTKQMMAFCI